MGFPEADKNITDALDFLTDACSEIIDVEQDGRIVKQQILNTDKVYYKTQMVNSPHFSRFVLELENFKGMADQCFNNMSRPRANVIAKQILSYVNSFKLSIDAKSSESLRDNLNTQSTLIHNILSNKVERSITLKGEAKKSFMNGFLGRDGQEESPQ